MHCSFSNISKLTLSNSSIIDSCTIMLDLFFLNNFVLESELCARIIWKTRSVKAKRLLLYYLMVYTTLISMFLYTQNFENNTCERGCLLTLELAQVSRHHGSPQPTESSLRATIFALSLRVLRRCCCSPVSYILHTAPV